MRPDELDAALAASQVIMRTLGTPNTPTPHLRRLPYSTSQSVMRDCQPVRGGSAWGFGQTGCFHIMDIYDL